MAFLMCPAGPKQRGRITSTHLLLMLCLTQTNKLLILFAGSIPCWLMFNLVPIRTSTPYSVSLFSRHSSSQTVTVHGAIFPGCSTLHFPLLKFTWLKLQLTVGLKKSFKLFLQSIRKWKCFKGQFIPLFHQIMSERMGHISLFMCDQPQIGKYLIFSLHLRCLIKWSANLLLMTSLGWYSHCRQL